MCCNGQCVLRLLCYLAHKGPEPVNEPLQLAIGVLLLLHGFLGGVVNAWRHRWVKPRIHVSGIGCP